MQEKHYCCNDYFYMTFVDNKYYTYFCGCLCLYNFDLDSCDRYPNGILVNVDKLDNLCDGCENRPE
jgi:hypothetical protein